MTGAPFRGPVPEATEGHGQVPASNPDFISQILLLEICINVEGEKRSALCHCSSHISGSAAIQGFRVLSEGAVGVLAAGGASRE